MVSTETLCPLFSPGTYGPVPSGSVSHRRYFSSWHGAGGFRLHDQGRDGDNDLQPLRPVVQPGDIQPALSGVRRKVGCTEIDNDVVI